VAPGTDEAQRQRELTKQALAESAGGVFFFVYLLKAGLSVEAALLSQAAIFTLRFALRPAMLPLAVRS